jgi:drug/metabolite transporter (DMT)-like permease
MSGISISLMLNSYFRRIQYASSFRSSDYRADAVLGIVTPMKLPSIAIGSSGIVNPSTLKGVGYMLVATFFAAGMNVMIRHITSLGMHPFEAAFFRVFFGLLVFLPLFMRQGFAPLRTKRLGLHLFRGGLTTLTMMGTFMALSMTPVAQVVAIKFSGPLFAALIAMIIMGEIMRVRRIVAMIIGFAGTLVIMGPNFTEFDLGTTLALISSIFWAMMFVTVKVLSRTESSITITIYMSLIASPFLAIAAIPYWQMPTLEQLGWLMLLGSTGSLVHVCFAQALKNADVSVISPMDFCKLLWVSLLAFVAFGEIPTTTTWIGAIMIFSSATYIAYRERKVKPTSQNNDPPTSARLSA